jgi:hypothetical protein
MKPNTFITGFVSSARGSDLQTITYVRDPADPIRDGLTVQVGRAFVFGSASEAANAAMRYGMLRQKMDPAEDYVDLPEWVIWRVDTAPRRGSRV